MYLDFQTLSPTSVPIGYSDKGLVFGFKPLEAGSLTQFQRSGLKSLGLERLRRQGAWILISMYCKFWIYFTVLDVWVIVLTLVKITILHSFFLYVERLSDFVQYGEYMEELSKTWLTLRNSFYILLSLLTRIFSE